jgi:hypothetical protein
MEEKLKVETEDLKKVFDSFKFLKLSNLQMLKKFLDSDESKKTDPFLISNKNEHTLFGDCITSSFHFMKNLESISFKPFYISGNFKTKHNDEYHFIPCIYHVIDGDNVALTLLDVSRSLFIQLIPGVEYEKQGQKFLWFGDIVYQTVGEFTKSLPKKKGSISDCKIFKISEYNENSFKTILSDHFCDLAKQDTKILNLQFNPLSIEDKYSVQDVTNENFIVSSLEKYKKNYVKKLDEDKALKTFVGNKTEDLWSFYENELKSSLGELVKEANLVVKKLERFAVGIKL